MVDVPVPGEDVEEIPNLHRRPVEAWHGRRGHLLPVPVRRRQVCVRSVQVSHRLGALPHHLREEQWLLVRVDRATKIAQNMLVRARAMRRAAAWYLSGRGGRERGGSTR